MKVVIRKAVEGNFLNSFNFHFKDRLHVSNYSEQSSYVGTTIRFINGKMEQSGPTSSNVISMTLTLKKDADVSHLEEDLSAFLQDECGLKNRDYTLDLDDLPQARLTMK